MPRLPRLTAAAGTLAALALVAGCSQAPASAESQTDKTELTIGFNPGPYFEMFEEGIRPILEEDGYTIKTRDFTDGVIVNVAVDGGEIDANIMQHPVYMEAINAQEGLDNAALVQVPGPPMAVFGGKASSLDDGADGATVAVPNQPSNQYRALKVLESIGWVELSADIDTATASLQDVTGNPHDLAFVEMENAQQVASLGDVDFSVIQGNFIVSGGLSFSDALAVEELTDEFSVVVTVAEANLDTPWARAIKDAYESPEFAEYIRSESIYDGYNLPAALED